jgi:hypothetical protein
VGLAPGNRLLERSVSRLGAVLLFSLVSLPAAAGAVSPDGKEVAASWQRHEIEFTYMGFTTRYSCDGLRSKMKLLLKASGARPDFKVTTRACTDLPGRVEPFPRVRMVFHTAALPKPGEKDLGEPVLARWKAVTLTRRQPRDLELGDCELVEQFRDRVLPAFATRKLSSDIRCIPHQLSGTSFALGYEVLEGLPEPDAAKPRR